MRRREFIEGGAHQQLEQALTVGVQHQKRFSDAIASAGPASSITVMSVVEDTSSPAIKEAGTVAIIIEVLIHTANKREADSLAGALTSQFLNAQLAQVEFPPVSIVEPWPAIQPFNAHVNVGGGEPLPLQLDALDKGGNLVQEPLNVSVSLMEQREVSREFECKGQSSCLVLINVTVPHDYVLVEAFLDVSVKCSDFDYDTEQLRRLSVGGFDLLKMVGFSVNRGPFPGCFASCDSNAIVLSKYSVLSQVRQAAIDGEESIPVFIEVSPDVNLSPCDGFVLSASVNLRLNWAVPSPLGNFAGPALVNMHGSFDLRDAAIRRSPGFYLLRFTSPGVRGTHLHWIYVATGQPAKILLLKQPTNSTGGVALAIQPLLAISDAGGNVVEDCDSLFSVKLIVPTAMCAFSAPVLQGTTCEANFCIANVGVGDGRHSLSLRTKNLNGSLDLQVLGSGNYTDLSVNVAAMGYQMNFSAIVSLPNSSVVFHAMSALFSINAGPAARLALYTETPKQAFGGQPLSTSPIVAASDVGGNFVGLTKGDELQVTAGIGTNGAVAGQLRGARVQVIDSESNARCYVNFTDLALTLRGSGYTIVFAAPGLMSVETAPLNVITGPASQLRVLRCATRGIAGLPLIPQPVAQLEDAGGNQILTGEYNVSVRLLPTSDVFPADSDARMHGQVANISTFNGRAYFYDLTISAASSDWSLEFFVEGHVGIIPSVASGINITAAAGSVNVQGDVTFIQSLQDGSTGLSRTEKLAFVESLAQVLALSPEDITILEVFVFPKSTILTRRRHLLNVAEYEVVIKFEISVQQEVDSDDGSPEPTDAPSTPTSESLLQDSIAKKLLRLTKESLQEAFGQRGVQVEVQELQAQPKPKFAPTKDFSLASLAEEDIWNGWWMIETPTGPAEAGMAYHTRSSSSMFRQNQTLQLMGHQHLDCDKGLCNRSCTENCVQNRTASNYTVNQCCMYKCITNNRCSCDGAGSNAPDRCRFEDLLYPGLACWGTAQRGIGALTCHRAQSSNVLSEMPMASLRIETSSQVNLVCHLDSWTVSLACLVFRNDC